MLIFGSQRRSFGYCRNIMYRGFLGNGIG